MGWGLRLFFKETVERNSCHGDIKVQAVLILMDIDRLIQIIDRRICKALGKELAGT